MYSILNDKFKKRKDRRKTDISGLEKGEIRFLLVLAVVHVVVVAIRQLGVVVHSQLLHSIRVPQRIQRVLATRYPRTDHWDLQIYQGTYRNIFYKRCKTLKIQT